MSSNDERSSDARTGTLDDDRMSSVAPDDQTALGSASNESDATTVDDVGEGALLPADQNDRFRSRWEEIQGSFVDEPQKAVEEADALVADLAQRVTASLTKERERLESQWAAGDDVSTEELRVALTRYRTFFDRLLAA